MEKRSRWHGCVLRTLLLSWCSRILVGPPSRLLRRQLLHEGIIFVAQATFLSGLSRHLGFSSNAGSFRLAALAFAALPSLLGRVRRRRNNVSILLD